MGQQQKIRGYGPDYEAWTRETSRPLGLMCDSIWEGSEKETD